MDTPGGNPSKGVGRGVPSERRPLRQPMCTPEHYLSRQTAQLALNEGRGNGKETEPSVSCPQVWCTQESKEPHIPPLPSGDHQHSEPVKNQCSGSVQQQEKFITSNLSPYAKEFIPRNFQPEPRVPNISYGEIPEYPLRELRQFLSEVTYNPGKFERRVHQLTNILKICVQNDDTLRAIVNIIFDESVQERNLRYSGARLCNILSQNLQVSTDCSSFRQLLLQRCQQEHNRREALAEAIDNGTYFRGFAIFMAELFSQMEVGTAEHKQRINMIGDALPQIIDVLLTHHSSDNLKCTCQILKLVGAFLEDYERMKIPNDGNAPQLDRIITCIKEMACNNEYARDVKGMIMSVCELRASNWGRASSSPVVSEPVVSDVSVNEAVLYGPDGTPLTAEEALFMQSHYNSDVPDADDYDGEDICYSDEMDDEMAEYYELYLQDNELRH